MNVSSFLSNIAAPNFTVSEDAWQDCGRRLYDALLLYPEVNGNVTRYLYTRRPTHLLQGHLPPLLATYAGCRAYCGARPLHYEWQAVVESLLTWILPIAGSLLLQVPFESNAGWATFFLLGRWLGSPVVALMGTLWNIRVTGRCAALLDYAVDGDETPGYYDNNDASSADAEPYAIVRVWHNACRRLRPWLDGDVDIDDEKPRPGPRDGPNAFSHLRDSLYMLSVLNQYQLNYDYPVDDLKAFLGFALFSGSGNADADFDDDDDESDTDNNPRQTLRLRRMQLTESLRGARRHGIVPVLISLLWFFVSLALSIQQAYGRLGANPTAHNLAMGLLMCWLPVLVACTLVDRNPTNSGHVRGLLQGFFDEAWHLWTPLSPPPPARPSLQQPGPQLPDDEESEGVMIHELQPMPHAATTTPHISDAASDTGDETVEGEERRCLSRQQLTPSPTPMVPRRRRQQQQQQQSAPPLPPLVLAFSGQARRKWHYGVAHSILTDIERKVGAHGRWLGLKRRRRGYLAAYEDGAFEGIGSCSTNGDGSGENAAPTADEGQRRKSNSLWHFDMVEAWQMLVALLVVGLSVSGAFTMSYNTPTVGIGCRSAGQLAFGLLAFTCFALESLGWALHSGGRPRRIRFSHARLSCRWLWHCLTLRGSSRHHYHFRHRLHSWDCTGAIRALRVLLTGLELGNAGRLLYMLLAQTFGLYNSCLCKSSMWSVALGGSEGGYVDFERDSYYSSHYDIRRFWIAGTVLGCLPLALVLYVVLGAWLTQSFLFADEYDKAMRGLRRVRRARYVLGAGMWRDGWAAVRKALEHRWS